MKRKILTTLALCMSLAMPITFAQPTQAATVKLNKSAITIYKGKTYKLKVSGTKAKVKWTSSNKKIATVTSTGTVKGIKKGTTYVNAKVGSKTLKCKVTVKENEALSAKKISYKLQDTGHGVVAILTNKNASPVMITSTLVFLKSGKMLNSDIDYTWYLEPNESTVVYFDAPHDNDYNEVTYDDYKISLQVQKPLHNGTSKIEIKSNMGVENVTAEVTNNSGRNLTMITLGIVWYDSYGNPIDYDFNFAQCKSKGSTDYVTFNFPYDKEYNTIVPESYKIYLESAY